MIINRVCVFCASSNNVNPEYLDAAENLGKKLALGKREIIYGGGNVGLMGRLADGAISEKGKVIGVIPDLLDELELGHKGIAELRKVKDMHKREEMMIKDSDCIIALPGGCGTFSELMQAITWKHLGLIISPVIIVNLRGYFSHLIAQLELSVEENFRRETHYKLWKVADTIDDAIKMLK